MKKFVNFILVLAIIGLGSQSLAAPKVKGSSSKAKKNPAAGVSVKDMTTGGEPTPCLACRGQGHESQKDLGPGTSAVEDEELGKATKKSTPEQVTPEYHKHKK